MILQVAIADFLSFEPVLSSSDSDRCLTSNKMQAEMTEQIEAGRDQFQEQMKTEMREMKTRQDKMKEEMAEQMKTGHEKMKTGQKEIKVEIIMAVQ